jgi:hypothetical protein
MRATSGKSKNRKEKRMILSKAPKQADRVQNVRRDPQACLSLSLCSGKRKRTIFRQILNEENAVYLKKNREESTRELQ